MTQIIRQGDLTLVRVENVAIPTATSEIKDQILALGEESGHWHTLVSSIVSDIGDERYVTVLAPEGAEMRVEPEAHAHRHAPLTVPQGTWKVLGQRDERSIWLGQREYTPEAVRTVGD